MKTKEELSTLKEEYESLNKKLGELTDDEMEQVTGGMKIVVIKGSNDIVYKKYGVEVEDLTKPGEYCAPISCQPDYEIYRFQ